MSNSSDNLLEGNGKLNFREEYLDPQFWNPECEGFELIDWERWEAQNPAPPKIYDPPQRKRLSGLIDIPMWWSNRSWLAQPLPRLLHSCCGPKPNKERISDGNKLFSKLLKPECESEHAPEMFRNQLLWTEDNTLAPETLISFGSWAWRPQDKKNPRVIGVGTLEHGWTNNPSLFGFIFAKKNKSYFQAVQMSPDGKWIRLQGIRDPSKNGTVSGGLWMYIVQEGDEFTTPDGQVLEDIKPGDICRVSWDDNGNPYECDNTNLKYMYFPKKVVSLDSNGQLVKNQPHFDKLVEKATARQDKCCETCCYTCSCCMSPEDRFDFNAAFISDEQYYSEPSVPPPAALLERF